MISNMRYSLTRSFLLYGITMGVLLIIFVHIPRNSLKVYDQPVGTTVFFERITLKDDGYVVFFQKDEKGKEILVGHSDLFFAGVYTEKHVLPFWLENDKFEKGEIRMVLYRDKGDLYFDRNIDSPIKSATGKAISKTIRLN